MINAALATIPSPPTPATATAAMAAPTLAFTSLFATLPLAATERAPAALADAAVAPLTPTAPVDPVAPAAAGMPPRQSDADPGSPLPTAPADVLAVATRASTIAPVASEPAAAEPADQPRRALARLAIATTALTPLKFAAARNASDTDEALDADTDDATQAEPVDAPVRVAPDQPMPPVVAIPPAIEPQPLIPTPVAPVVGTQTPPVAAATEPTALAPAPHAAAAVDPQPATPTPEARSAARVQRAPDPRVMTASQSQITTDPASETPRLSATPDTVTSAPLPAPVSTPRLSIDVPPHARFETAVPRTDPAPALRPVTTGPAMQVFASAIVAASRREPMRDAAPTTDATLTALATVSAPVAQVAAAGDAQQGALDMTDARWPHAMVDRIERMRDAANAGDTRIRLAPDALGGIDVSVKRDGDTIHVHFAAEQAATRALIQDAQPRLAAAAQERGLSLGQTSVGVGVDAGQSQAGHQQRQPQPAAPSPSAPPRADGTETPGAATSGRLA